MLLRSMLHCYAAPYNTMQKDNTTQHNAILYHAIPYNTIHNTIQYHMLPLYDTK